MSKPKLIAAFFAVIALTAGQASAQHYYGGGDTIPLSIDSTKIMLKFQADVMEQTQQTIIASIDRIVDVVTDDHAIGGFIACSLSTGSGYGDFLDSVQAVDGIHFTEPFYLNSLDSAFLVGLTFCVAFDTSLSSAQIDSINAAKTLGFISD